MILTIGKSKSTLRLKVKVEIEKTDCEGDAKPPLSIMAAVQQSQYIGIGKEFQI